MLVAGRYGLMLKCLARIVSDTATTQSWVMSSRTIVRPEVRLQWVGTVDAGKQLELFADIAGIGHTLLTVVADDSDESLWLEFEAGQHLVQVPVARIVEMLEAAPGEVRSETWYEKNVYSKSKNP